MSVADDYRRQFAWRDWRRALELLPPLAGQRVLDLGCGVGDLAAELAARGAHVLGVDGNEELLGAARARGLEHAEFRAGDLGTLPDLGPPFDGLWCSFTAAYFLGLAPRLEAWARHLRPGGWIALTEIDDLFAHEPLEARTRELLEHYVGEALAAGRYDFRMGRKLEEHLARAGFAVTEVRTLADREFASDGPAPPEVVAAWRTRLAHMHLLHAACGREYERVRDDFLGCLARADHRSGARVVFCMARGGGWTRSGDPGHSPA